MPVASHAENAAVPAAYHRVASHVGTAAAAVAGASDEAATLLALMGRRGGWSVDALVEASGLRVGAVQYALMTLELDGRVACEAFGSYAPCATPEPYPLC
jgi:predicted Rossmann fold nucleotide-binding protein DprA/Smf involved in DNA uptake